MQTNTPKIRFKGFTEPWEIRKLSECFNERTERSANGELIAVTINSGIVKASELNRHDNSSEDKSNYKVVRVNDIAYNSMRMWQGASGYSKYDGILSPAYTVAIPQEGINSVFFSYVFKRVDMLHEFRINSQGLTSDTWNLKFTAFSKITTIVPNLAEQQKIGELFGNFDNLINLYGRKCESLKKIKKAMLYKMFPQNGESTPQIRFKGFTEPWEIRKLSEVFKIATRINTNNEYGRNDVLSVSDDFGVLNQIKFQGRSFAAEDVSSYKKVKIGDIVYTRSPLSAKPYGIIKIVDTEVGIVSPLYIVNEPRDGINSLFMYYIFDTPERTNNYLKTLVRKGAKNTMNISNDEWLSGNVLITPNLAEQQKIGEYFANLDRLIMLHDKKIQKLKSIKTALLNKAFAK